VPGLPPARPVIWTLAVIPSGERGTKATLEVMARLVRERRTDTIIRALVESIIQFVPEKDAIAEASAVQQWVRDNIRYTADVADVETLKDPVMLLQSRYGDCDDKSTLVAALLQTIGYPVRFVAIAFPHEEFSHVYAEVEIDGQWIAVETTEPVELGWFPENVAQYMRVTV